MNKSKIIATIGPATESKEKIEELILNGVDLIRLNMNYGTEDFYLKIVKNLREVDKKLNRNTGIIVDISGPIIKIDKIIKGKAQFSKGTKIRIYMHTVLGDNTKFSINYSNLVNEIQENQIIKTSDGNVEFKVISKMEEYLLCEVIKEGIIISDQKIIIPEFKSKNKYLNKKDYDDIKFADKIKADFLALSQVRSSEDVLEVNDTLIEIGNDHLDLLSKIETEEACEEIDELIRVSDGLIITRDDLGLILPMERIPGIQKAVINKCHQQGKISIVSIELLSSMEKISNPTKAEVSDVANAVLDGADAVTLCGETTIGKNPIETLAIVNKIVHSAEIDIDYLGFLDVASRSENKDAPGILSRSIVECANRLKCKAIIVPTLSGATAKKISRFRPKCLIIALTPNEKIAKQLNLYFGILPIITEEVKTFDEIIKQAKETAIKNLSLEKDDYLIITGGYPIKEKNSTNFIKIEQI